jgi:hypothetical protein
MKRLMHYILGGFQSLCSCAEGRADLTMYHAMKTYSVTSFFFLDRPLLPCGVEGFLPVNLLDNW